MSDYVSKDLGCFWFVDRVAGLLKYKIKPMFHTANALSIFFEKDKVIINSFDVLNNDKKMEVEWVSGIGTFYKIKSEYGCFFFEKHMAVKYMRQTAENGKLISDASKDYIRNHPEYLL